MSRAAVAVLATLLFALSAHAQVVVATSGVSGAPERAVASAVLGAVRERWDVDAREISEENMRGCAGDTSCLRALAKNQHATFVLVVGMSAVATRDHVLAVQLFNVETDAPIFEDTTLQSGFDPALDATRALAAHLLETRGPRARPPIAEARTHDLTMWGGGALALGALLGAGTGAVVLFDDGLHANRGGVLAVVGISTSAALLLAGSAAFVIDGL